VFCSPNMRSSVLSNADPKEPALLSKPVCSHAYGQEILGNAQTAGIGQGLITQTMVGRSKRYWASAGRREVFERETALANVIILVSES